MFVSKNFAQCGRFPWHERPLAGIGCEVTAKAAELGPAMGMFSLCRGQGPI